jgi:hypothetical protein
MRAVKLALFVIILQMGIGLITVSQLFGGVYYDTSLTGVTMPVNPDAMSEIEQSQTSVNIFNVVVDALTWSWIKQYFMPWYLQDTGLRLLVDTFINFLRVISGIIIGLAFLEFFRNKTEII